jgi:NAD(P)H-dependent FMN reductase
MVDGLSIRVLGISGSLRRGSFNTAALRAARELAPAGMEIEIFEGLREISPYDDDVRQARATRRRPRISGPASRPPTRS